MKIVIYKDGSGCLGTTPEDNYNRRIWNGRAIHRMPDFESVAEIIEYYCQWFGSSPADFIDRTTE